MTPVTYLARMTWRNADGLDEARSVEALDLEQARTVTRQWATWARQRPTPLTDLVIVIAHQRDGCTIQSEEVPVYVHRDRVVPPAADSIAKARAMLAEAAARRATELSGGFRP